ncbi:hypothetical protein SEA_KEELAN_95 [Gordonia phage Keelan]|nr:hypothetical protein SEA_KEELAN_95 [Gordonia phage Keelan]
MSDEGLKITYSIGGRNVTYDYYSMKWTIPPNPFEPVSIEEKKEEPVVSTVVPRIEDLPQALVIDTVQQLIELPTGAMIMDGDHEILIRRDVRFQEWDDEGYRDDAPFKRPLCFECDCGEHMYLGELGDWLPAKIIHLPEWWPGMLSDDQLDR